VLHENKSTGQGIPFWKMKKPKGHEEMVKGGGDTTCHGGGILFSFSLFPFFVSKKC